MQPLNTAQRREIDTGTQPPAEAQAQGGGEVGKVEQTHPMMGSGFMHTFTYKERLPEGTPLYLAPPSAPVGVEVRALPGRWRTHKSGLSALGCANELENSLAQQPATTAEIRAVQRAREFLARSDASEAEGDAFTAGWFECETSLAQQPAAVPEKRAPVQRYNGETIPWRVHGLAWEAYAKQHGTSQSAARLAERGGFDTEEMDEFLPGWREMAEEIQQPAAVDGASVPQSRQQKAAREGVCLWSQQDEGYDTYSTGCGHEFTVNDCTDGDVKLPYCPYCALELESMAWRPDDEGDSGVAALAQPQGGA